MYRRHIITTTVPPSLQPLLLETVLATVVISSSIMKYGIMHCRIIYIFTWITNTISIDFILNFFPCCLASYSKDVSLTRSISLIRDIELLKSFRPGRRCAVHRVIQTPLSTRGWHFTRANSVTRPTKVESTIGSNSANCVRLEREVLP